MGLCNCNCKRLRDTKRNEHELFVPPFFLFEMGGLEGVWEAGRVWGYAIAIGKG